MMSTRECHRCITAAWLCVVSPLLLLLLLLLQARPSLGFAPTPAVRTFPDAFRLCASAGNAVPILQKIQGVHWEGSCRYVNADMVPASFRLTGGIRFDVVHGDDGDDANGTGAAAIELHSFVVFPNGKRRDIQMRGTHNTLTEEPTIRLDSNDGPIYMVLAEVDPDTILIHEIDKESNKVVMTSSLSLVTTRNHDDNDDAADSSSSPVQELIQVSHEITSAAAGSAPEPKDTSVIHGHQIWRFYRIE